MNRLTNSPETVSPHSIQWDTGTPAEPGTHVIDAIISNQVEHAELRIGPGSLHLAKPQAYMDLLFDRYKNGETQLAPESLEHNKQLLHAIGKSAFVLFSPEQLYRSQDESPQLIATPLQTNSSLVLETSPDSPYQVLRHNHQPVQIAEVSIEPSSDVRLEVFDIDTDLKINIVRSLGHESVRTYNSGWTNYLAVKSVDTTEGVFPVRRR